MATQPTTKTTLELDPHVGELGLDVIVEVIQNGKSVRTTVGDVVKRATASFAIANGLSMDAVTNQTTIIDNTGSAAKTVTISNAPVGRAMTYVAVINGNAGVVSWPAGVVWDKNTQPKPGATRTVVVLFWDGAAFIGAQGATA